MLKPTAAQRVKFEEFRSTSSNAGAACPTEIPGTMVGHMQAMEKLTDAKSKAIKTVLRRWKLSMQRLAPVRRLFSIPGKDAVVSRAGMIPCRSVVSGMCPRAAAQAWYESAMRFVQDAGNGAAI